MTSNKRKYSKNNGRPITKMGIYEKVDNTFITSVASTIHIDIIMQYINMTINKDMTYISLFIGYIRFE